MGLERSGRPPRGRDALRATLAAITAAVPAIAQAGEGSPTLIGAPRLGWEGREAAPSSRAAQEAPGLAQIIIAEENIIAGRMPLREALTFLGRGFTQGGWYHLALEDQALSLPRLSRILQAVDAVSARMNQAYEASRRGEITAERIELFRHVDMMRRATTTIRLASTPGKGIFCNASLSRDAAGNVFEDTAAHCEADAHQLEEEGFALAADESGLASRLLTPRDLDVLGIAADAPLPQVLAPGTDIAGKTIVTVNTSPRGIDKTHFSIAMPFTPRVAELLFGRAQVPGMQPGASGFMLKPAAEGRIIGTDPATGKPVSEMQGSSGSGVFVADGGAVFHAGSVMQGVQIADECRRLCLGVTVFTTPATNAHMHETLVAGTPAREADY